MTVLTPDSEPYEGGREVQEGRASKQITNQKATLCRKYAMGFLAKCGLLGICSLFLSGVKLPLGKEALYRLYVHGH